MVSGTQCLGGSKGLLIANADATKIQLKLKETLIITIEVQKYQKEAGGFREKTKSNLKKLVRKKEITGTGNAWWPRETGTVNINDLKILKKKKITLGNGDTGPELGQ